MSRKTRNMIGEVFGRLTVIEPVIKENTKKKYWKCKCSCGNDLVTEQCSLVTNKTKSCGCLKIEKITELGRKNAGLLKRPRKDLTGRTFGRLTVVGVAEERRGKHASIVYECSCECGGTKFTTRNPLVGGYCRSCGCLLTEFATKHMTELQKAKKASNPSKDKPKRNNNPRHIKGVGKFRSSIIRRDNKTCQCCGYSGDEIVVHHLEDFSHNPDIRLDIDNGVTLCVPCHKQFHSIYGMRRQTYTWQFLEFIQTPIKEVP